VIPLFRNFSCGAAIPFQK